MNRRLQYMALRIRRNFLKRMSERSFVLVLSFAVGLLSGLAAIILKNTVHYTHHFLATRFDIDSENYLYLLSPMVGIGLAALFVYYFVKDDINHGISRILYAISRKKGKIASHNMYSSIVASTLTVGFGGSVGLEAPIVLTGGSIGSNLGQWFRLNYKNTLLLIGCGAAGAVAGIFNAPVAGIVFVIEVLMLDLTLTTAIPLLISSATAAMVSFFLMGNAVQFSYPVENQFQIHNFPWYIVMGIFAGFVSLYFLRISRFVERQFAKISSLRYRWLIGGILLGGLIFLFPPLFGEGYDTLMMCLRGEGANILNNSFFYPLKNSHYLWFILILLVLMIFKAVATAATTGSGGIGGVFAPSLFLGGIAGFFFANVINHTGLASVSESNFALAGMAGVMTGVMHAPLTAIFLIAEITGGYNLFVPLLITSAVSYITIRPFERYSIYTKQLAKKGDLITHHKDKAALTLMKMDKIIEHDFITIHPNDTLRSIINAISNSSRNIFPVIDEHDMFLGVVVMDDVRSVIFNTKKYDTTFVKDYMFMPDITIELKTDRMADVTEKFQRSKTYNLPVVDDGKYVGFLSRANIFTTYREMVKDFSED